MSISKRPHFSSQGVRAGLGDYNIQEATIAMQKHSVIKLEELYRDHPDDCWYEDVMQGVSVRGQVIYSIVPRLRNPLIRVVLVCPYW